MIKLDDNLLQELGLGSLPPEEKKKMLAHIYETLEMRVGMALAKQMNDGQLNEFEQFIKSNDEAGALRWLESNFPNYRDVVAAEFEKLKGEVKQSAPQILAASQQAAGQQPVPAYPPPHPGQQQMAQPYSPPQGSYAAPMPQQAGAMPQQASQPYGPPPQMPPQQPQPQMPQPGYSPQPQQQGPPAGQQPYYQPQPQGQPQPGQGQSTPGYQPQPGQPFDPQQQAQPYPPQQPGPQAPNGYQQ